MAGKALSTALKIHSDETTRGKFQQAVDQQHANAVRTSVALQKVVLLPRGDEQETRLTDFAKGQVDPQMQLMLIARDHFQAAEDDASKLGFFKAMRDVFLSVDDKTMKIMDMAMRERHHQEKLAVLREKLGSNEPTDAQLEADAAQTDA